MAGEHLFNRRAFGTSPQANSLLNLYVRLIALELKMKDQDGKNRALKHDVIAMTNSLNDAAVTATLAALDRTLTTLKCTHKNGTSVIVPADNYPFVRYLRH